MMAGVTRQKGQEMGKLSKLLLTLKGPLFPVRPHPKDSLSWGSNVQTVSLWGTFHISNHSILVSWDLGHLI